MHISREKMIAVLGETEEKLKAYSLPLWEALPDLELYMDQVISLLKKYMAIYHETIGDEKSITASMINNYVKLGIMPAPVKKKYSKIHMAYLLVICTLKPTLDMATIQKIMPTGISEEEAVCIYNSFVLNQRKAHQYVTEKVRAVADPILALEENGPDRRNDLLMQMAAAANICKILTEATTKIEE